jgi:hypothetical protein
LLDGLVLPRSAFHHSMNYRSVVVFGRATLVDDPAEKVATLRALSEHMIPGRWDDVREPNEQEMKQTTVLSLPLTEASAKVRTGPPLDNVEDYDLPVWAGVIPLKMVAGEPFDDGRMRKCASRGEMRDNKNRWSRGKRGNDAFYLIGSFLFVTFSELGLAQRREPSDSGNSLINRVIQTLGLRPHDSSRYSPTLVEGPMEVSSRDLSWSLYFRCNRSGCG